MNELEFSNLIVFMNVGEYGEESLPNTMTRIKAEYEHERRGNPKAFYPIGYQVAFPSGYTASRLRNLISERLEAMKRNHEHTSHVDVVFSSTYSKVRERNLTNHDLWRECCYTGIFPDSHDLGPKRDTWRYMDQEVRGTSILPAHYDVTGGECER